MANTIPGHRLVSVNRYDTDGAFVWTNPGASLILVDGCGGGAGGGGAGTTLAGEMRFTWFGLTAKPAQVLIQGPPDSLAINIGAGGAGGQGVGAVSVAGSDGADTTVIGEGISLTFAKGKALQAETYLTSFPQMIVTDDVLMGPHAFSFNAGQVLINTLPAAVPFNAKFIALTVTNARSINTMAHGSFNIFGPVTIGASGNADGVTINPLFRGAGGVPGTNSNLQAVPRLGSPGVGGGLIIRAFV